MNNKEYNTITVFKYFLSFLEVWKEENYGTSAEINWQAVWGFVNTSGVLDGNDELAELVHSKPDEVEEKIHTWLENRILNDEPVYLLFKMSPWLFDKLEKERNENILSAEKKRFDECKCYKCKYWKDLVSIWIEQYGMLETYHVGECNDELWECHPIHHNIECLKHKELYEKLTNGRLGGAVFNTDIEFSYKPFNDMTRTHKFYPNPQKLTDCPYFEDTKITYDEYIEKYKELA